MGKTKIPFLTSVAIFAVACSKNGLKTELGSNRFSTTNINTSLASGSGDVGGKVIVGDQGWFSCVGIGCHYRTLYFRLLQWL
jgi:hypothetical protein